MNRKKSNKQEKKKSTHNFYDRISKYLFSNTAFIRNLIEFSVPKELLPLLNFNTIKAEKTNFVPKNLRSREADAIYGVKLKNGEEIYIYFLIEFQTYVDKFMPLRLYIYTALFYDELMKQEKIKNEVPIILPIVLYTGDKKWGAGKKLSALMDKELYRIVKGYAPELKYILIDKNMYKNTELEEMKNIISKILYMEKSKSGEEFIKRFRKLWEIIPRGMKREEINVLSEYLISLLKYKYDIKIDENKIGKVENIEEVNNMLVDAVEDWKNSLIEKGIQRGIQRGIQKGIQRGIQKGIQRGIQKGIQRGIQRGIQQEKLDTAKKMLANGAKIAFIEAVTGLTAKEIEKLKK